MNRRDFLARAVPATALPFLLHGFRLQAYGRSPLVDALTSSALASDRVLVLIQLNGGNDGLNMVIPLDRYAELSAARSNILIPAARVLPLTTTTGLHPSMTGLQSLYAGGQLTVIQSVGYPNPNFSHFRATDIWLTATDASVVGTTGWLGRYLEREFPGYPVGYPDAAMPDPLALQIGSVVTTGLQGTTVEMGLAVTDPTSTYIFPGGADAPPDLPWGHELSFLRQVAQQTQQYSVTIKAAAAKGKNLAVYPASGSNSLADQLKIVARLISGGLMTRIYVVNLGGFDTHANQAAADTATGVHATLLGRLSAAIAAFQDDLTKLGVAQRVIGMTFSEFGRRIKSNSSVGTDHGTAAPLFLFGANVAHAVIGTSPVLPAAATVNDNVPLQFDFRSVYASILRDWFGASAAELNLAVTGTVLAPYVLPASVIKPNAVLQSDGTLFRPAQYALEQNYPNPFNPTTTIRFDLPEDANVALEVFNTAGQRVSVLVNGPRGAGTYEVTFDARGLASGAYICRLRAGDHMETRKMLYIR